MPTRAALAIAWSVAVLTAVLPPVRPAAQATTVIRGHVQIGVPVTTRMPGAAYGFRSVPHAALAPTSEIKHVVVYLRDAPAQVVGPRSVDIRQRNENFVPRVVAVTIGSHVGFPNDDPIFHNVFSLSRTKAFNLGRYPQNETRRVRFDKPGMVKVFCEIHSHMTATVMVFNHPWFAVPDDDGQFELAGVPPGAHEVTAWHERLGDTTARVDVEPGRPASLEFVLPVPPQ